MENSIVLVIKELLVISTIHLTNQVAVLRKWIYEWVYYDYKILTVKVCDCEIYYFLTKFSKYYLSYLV
jgi:hypothetical protein